MVAGQIAAIGVEVLEEAASEVDLEAVAAVLAAAAHREGGK